MPLYDFKCEQCGAVRETIQKHTVEELPCQECDGVAKRLVSMPAYVYGDFYDKEKKMAHTQMDKIEKYVAGEKD